MIFIYSFVYFRHETVGSQEILFASLKVIATGIDLFISQGKRYLLLSHFSSDYVIMIS